MPAASTAAAAAKSKTSSSSSAHSLLTVILDVSPLTWREREWLRASPDRPHRKGRDGKPIGGPAVLEEVLLSLQAFLLAARNIERHAGIVVLAVADNESAIVHPRADQLQQWLNRRSGDSGGGSILTTESDVVDPRQLQHDLVTGIAELVARAANKAPLNQDPANRLGGMAAALSKALCLMNRFLVAAHTGRGVSALRTDHYLDRVDEEGVIAMIGKQQTNSNNKRGKDTLPSSAWSPRILLIQASDDRSRDYNAFMNCAFAASKQRIVLDACFLASGAEGAATSSSFLEQAVDLTGGVFFLVPSGAAQVGGALTGVLNTVFLASPACRPALHLPALDKVDFLARCFETGETVDKAMVCNLCLSIFKTIAPAQTHCPTCQAPIVR